MKVSIVGTGYVGLVTGACLADVGNHVLCLDVDERKIAMLRRGEIPIFEPGLREIVRANAAAGRLSFTTDPARERALRARADDRGRHAAGRGRLGRPAVRARRRARASRRTWTGRASSWTSPRSRWAPRTRCAPRSPGRSRPAARRIPFSMVSNPEFLKEGAAVEDFMRPDRIVIGADDSGAIEAMRELYAPFQRNHERLQVMDIRSAELTKYAANAMLATRISFMNELALLAERLGADIEHVRKGIGSDPRIGYHFLYPGAGYGGSCFPEGRHGAPAHGAGERHRSQGGARRRGGQRAPEGRAGGKDRRGASARTSPGRRIALWGLAFKPNTDDMREAPSRVVIDGLLARGAAVSAFDPVAMPEARHVYAAEPRVQLRRGRARGRGRRRRARDRHRVEGVPQPGFRRAQAPPRLARHLRRPQPLRAGGGARARASSTSRSGGHERRPTLPDFAGCRVLVVGRRDARPLLVRRRGAHLARGARAGRAGAAKVEERPGGAANVARNIDALGGQATLLSVIGDDEAGARAGEAARGKAACAPRSIATRRSRRR